MLLSSVSVHGVREAHSEILCQYIIMHVGLLWPDKMIGGGWEEGIIQCVAPAGWTWCPRGPLISREARRPPDTSHLSPCPLRSLSPVSTTPADTYLIGWLHVWTRQTLIALVSTRWHVLDWATLYSFCSDSAGDWLTFCLAPSGRFSLAFLCVYAVCQDGLVRWQMKDNFIDSLIALWNVCDVSSIMVASELQDRLWALLFVP